MSNPNAVVAIVAGGPGAQVVLELSSVVGWRIDPGLAIYISAGIAGLALFIGRAGAVVAANGVKGCWRIFLDGRNPPIKET